MEFKFVVLVFVERGNRRTLSEKLKVKISTRNVILAKISVRNLVILRMNFGMKVPTRILVRLQIKFRNNFPNRPLRKK